ncbi:MAG TPA: lysine biosynthesis protein LysX [Synergistales bacterium]|nr:lysine biosynthesis protein LysX [Synergistales bacterium]
MKSATPIRAPRLLIPYSRLRQEEKMLASAAERLGLPVDFRDVASLFWPRDFDAAARDVAVCRCVGQTHNLAVARLLESRGVKTINSSSVMTLCGDKIATAARLEAAGIPQPEYAVAASPEAAVEAAEELGYPVVFKPACGSWGRLLAKVSDRPGAEAVAFHKAAMGAAHSVFFIQKYVEKPGSDLRAILLGGQPVSLMRRRSSHWITNTARGGSPEPCEIPSPLADLLRSVARAVGGDFLAVDLFETSCGWLVNEVNGQPEFHGSVEATGLDLAGMLLKYAWNFIPRD